MLHVQKYNKQKLDNNIHLTAKAMSTIINCSHNQKKQEKAKTLSNNGNKDSIIIPNCINYNSCFYYKYRFFLTKTIIFYNLLVIKLMKIALWLHIKII